MSNKDTENPTENLNGPVPQQDELTVKDWFFAGFNVESQQRGGIVPFLEVNAKAINDDGPCVKINNGARNENESDPNKYINLNVHGRTRFGWAETGQPNATPADVEVSGELAAYYLTAGTSYRNPGRSGPSLVVHGTARVQKQTSGTYQSGVLQVEESVTVEDGDITAEKGDIFVKTGTLNIRKHDGQVDETINVAETIAALEDRCKKLEQDLYNSEGNANHPGTLAEIQKELFKPNDDPKIGGRFEKLIRDVGGNDSDLSALVERVSKAESYRVQSRPLFPLAGGNYEPKDFDAQSSVFVKAERPFTKGFESAPSGTKRRFRLRAIYSDTLSQGKTQITIKVRNGGDTVAKFDLPISHSLKTWPRMAYSELKDINISQDKFLEFYIQTVNGQPWGGHPLGGRLYSLCLQAVDEFDS